MLCTYTRDVGGTVHCCEREDGHMGEHMFAFTPGQLYALQHLLEHPNVPYFPSEAVLLIVAAISIGIETFKSQRTALDEAVSLTMVAIAIRWIRQWVSQKRRVR